MTNKGNWSTMIRSLCKRAASLMGPQGITITEGDVFIIDGRGITANGPYDLWKDEAAIEYVDELNRMVLQSTIGPELANMASEIQGPFYWVRSPERIWVDPLPRVKAHG